MSNSLRVRVVEFGDRAHYQLQWTCPQSGRKKTKSSGIERTGRKRDRELAQRRAAEVEAALLSGRFASGDRLTWEAFRERYEGEACKALADSTASKVASVFKMVEAILNPSRLSQITAERLSYFQSEMRKQGLAESSIKSNLAHLKAALRWAERVGLLGRAPTFEMPKRASDKMKGRPITAEEFDRMLAKVEAGLMLAARKGRKGKPKEGPTRPRVEAKAASDAPAYRRLLRGLWLSGLRISEALRLYWDDDNQLRVDLSGRRPMLWIPARLDKGRKDRLLPITPDFAAFLAETPKDQRTGRVFPGVASTREDASRKLSAIGEAALVKIGTSTEGKPQFATAHDLRRSFGERWAAKVMPQVLMELMRHEAITTTMAFYVGRNAERTADAVWAAHEANGNTFGNSGTPAAAGDHPATDRKSLPTSTRSGV